MFNMNLLQSNSLGDVSLESIEVMAMAWGEYGNPLDCRWDSDEKNCTYKGQGSVCVPSTSCN